MTIELSREVEALAETAATTLGFRSVAAFVEEAVKEKATNTMAAGAASVEDKLEAMRVFVASHEPTGHPVDDSRDSIYPDRS